MSKASLRNGIVGIAAATAVLLAFPGSVFAQSDEDRRNCFSLDSDNYKNESFYETGVAACDKFIKSGNLRGTQLMPYVRQRADWYRRQRNFDRALADFAWAIELDPEDVENYDFRGDVFTELGQYQRAIDDYNTSIRIKPDYPPAYYARGQAYEKLGRPDDAVDSYRKAANLTVPDSVTNSNTRRLYRWGIEEARGRLRELGK